MLWRQYVEGDHFKIHVISQQTASEMGDHMILSALITCSFVKWLVTSCVKRRASNLQPSRRYCCWWRDQHSCRFLQVLLLVSVLICALFMKLWTDLTGGKRCVSVSVFLNLCVCRIMQSYSDHRITRLNIHCWSQIWHQFFISFQFLAFLFYITKACWHCCSVKNNIVKKV